MIFKKSLKNLNFLKIKVALGYGSCLPGSPWAAHGDGLIFDNASTASAPKNKKCDSCTFSTYSNLKIKRRHHKTYWPLFCRQYGHSASFLHRLGHVGYDHSVTLPLAFMNKKVWLEEFQAQYNTSQHDAVYYSIVQYNTSQRSTAHSTAQYRTVQHSPGHCSRVQYAIVQCSIIQLNIVQYSTIQWNRVRAQHSIVQDRVALYSTAQYSTG